MRVCYTLGSAYRTFTEMNKDMALSYEPRYLLRELRKSVEVVFSVVWSCMGMS